MNYTYILLGGLFSWDGYATSNGMLGLKSRIAKLPNTKVKHYLWADYLSCHHDMLNDYVKDKCKMILIGYSGGGAHATWLARGYDYRLQKFALLKPWIDLLVAYDPSPQAGMMSIKDTFVKRAICYHNTHPFMFGLGGGILEGPQVENIDISMQHLAVQYSRALHDNTMKAINALS